MLMESLGLVSVAYADSGTDTILSGINTTVGWIFIWMNVAGLTLMALLGWWDLLRGMMSWEERKTGEMKDSVKRRLVFLALLLIFVNGLVWAINLLGLNTYQSQGASTLKYLIDSVQNGNCNGDDASKCSLFEKDGLKSGDSGDGVLN